MTALARHMSLPPLADPHVVMDISLDLRKMRPYTPTREKPCLVNSISNHSILGNGMQYYLKRLLPGIGLIVLASLIILLADRFDGRSARESLSPPPGGAGTAAASPDAAASSATAAGTVAPQRWKIQLLDFADSVNAEDTHTGLFAEFQALGLVSGRDYELQRHSAHGDMAVLNGIVDAAINTRPDLIITTSTPTLQVAVSKVKKIPVIFTVVADGVQAGAGESAVRHLPNITGVTTMSDFDGMARLVREYFPAARRIGTLFVPGEVNSVRYKEELVKAAKKSGLSVETVGIATTAEVTDAALALANRRVDIITQISDNTTGSAIPAIAEAARKARIPLFGFVSGTVKGGAAVVMARDYEEGGRLGARLAARIMKGENPAAIPFTPLTRTAIIVSPKNAASFGMSIPPALMKRADKIVN